MITQHLFNRRYTRPGAAPGAIEPRPAAPAPRLMMMQFEASSFEERLLDPAEDLASLLKPGKVTWLDARGVMGGPLLESIGQVFGLHPLALADVANVGQRPKVEDYDDTLFCVLNMATVSDEGVQWEQVSLFLGRHFVLTFQEGEGDCLTPLRERIRTSRGKVRSSGCDYLAVMVIDAIVDGYFPVLERYGEVLEDIEEEILFSPSRDDLQDIYRIKRELLAFRRAAWPLRDTLASLLRDRHALLSKPTLPYLRDATDHVFQVVDVIETYRETTASFVDVYLSSVSHRTNEVMRFLTVIASIFIPLTFIAGVYGMNFDTRFPLNMPELEWRFGYIGFWALCGAVAGSLLLMFRRLGWLGRPAPPVDEE